MLPPSLILSHPGVAADVDPANRYLMHYSSEAPEPQNFYNGLTELDERGEA